ncbi:MAG: hypothetical protein RL307_665 [Pseudomonadota bacterium]|jgi:thiol-disulfide isomerase/thioredoxin
MNESPGSNQSHPNGSSTVSGLQQPEPLNQESQADQALPISRRQWLTVLGASGALAAGLGWLTWQGQQDHALPISAAQTLWSSEFDTPQGEPLKLSGLRGKPLLINFWATWCPPCVQEIPLLVDFYRQNAAKGWQILGLAIDQPSRVKRFMTELDMPYLVGLAGLNGTELMKILGNDNGGLPFTLALAADGSVLMKKLGQLHAPDLANLAKLSV